MGLSQEEKRKLLLATSAKLIKLKHGSRKKGSHLCAFPECENSSIRSHLLQRNGVLDRISEAGQLIAPTEKPSYSISERFVLKKTGVGEALTYPVFCNYHDTSLFESIEKRDLDLANKWDNILLGYRATATERRKKEIILKISSDMYSKKSTNLSKQHPKWLLTQFNKEIEEYKKAIERAKRDEYWLGQLMNGQYDRSLIQTCCRMIPQIDICCSSVFSYYETLSESQAFLTPIYFNIVPYKGYGYVSWSWTNSRATKLIEKLYASKMDEFLKAVSDILLTKVENWVVSPSFYKNYLKKHEEEMMNVFSLNFQLKEYNAVVKLNMFETYIGAK